MTEWFDAIFAKQKALQKDINDGTIPVSSVQMYNSATAMIVEIGEMLQEDTRWKQTVTKSKKEPKYNKDAFQEELADVFIYLLNVILYSGTSVKEFKQNVSDKLAKNYVRFAKGATQC